jgi:hypothetical protein
MIAQASVLLSSTPQTLALATSHSESQFLWGIASEIVGFSRQEILTPAHQHSISHAGKALAEAKIVDSIKQVALTHAVIAQKTIYFRGEVELRLGYVLKIRKRKVDQLHFKCKFTKKFPYFCLHQHHTLPHDGLKC